MEAYAVTHTGKVRTNNEDSYFISRQTPSLFIVADGMGGHKAGEVASQMAVDEVCSYIQREMEGTMTPELIEEMLLSAVRSANAQVFEQSRSTLSLEGMGTTLTLLLVVDNVMYFAHVGDSRAYIVKNDTIEQVTKDHSLVGELVRAGTITEEQARVHPQKNILTNAVGTGLTVKVDIVKRRVESGLVLLCTDGLTNHVEDAEILNALNSDEPLSHLCEGLVREANEQGGQDNITVVAVKCSLSDEGVNS